MTQKEALSILRTGESVFLTGEAGSGKTYTINEYTKFLRAHKVPFAVTASTGIAATHIGGMTLHSWSGIGIADTLTESEIKKIAKTAYIAKRIKKTSVLIVDEISMLDGRVLTLVETVCRIVRKSSLPFGGMQVVLVGDFFQLPPVSAYGKETQFAFESEAWQRLVPTICYLEEQHRQEDQSFLALLTALRKSACEEDHYELLRDQLISLEEAPRSITRLYSHNADVDSMNLTELNGLVGEKKVYTMSGKGVEVLIETLKRGCLSPERLELKVGAVVMFTKNNQSAGYVNGTQGTIIAFGEESKLPIVKTKNGNIITVEPVEWTMSEGDENLATISQLPLRLAWAMTIHKSQGVSLDSAVIDLSKTFEYGQGYVALSRVRTLRGLHLLGINNRALEVHPNITDLDQEMRQAAKETQQSLKKIDKETQNLKETNFIITSGGKKKKI